VADKHSKKKLLEPWEKHVMHTRAPPTDVRFCRAAGRGWFEETAALMGGFGKNENCIEVQRSGGVVIVGTKRRKRYHVPRKRRNPQRAGGKKGGTTWISFGTLEDCKSRRVWEKDPGSSARALFVSEEEVKESS